MRLRSTFLACVLVGLVACAPAAFAAMEMHHHGGAAMDSTMHRGPRRAAHPRASMPAEHPHDAMDMASMGHEMAMNGNLGPYAMTREASGTSWQPDAAAHQGLHLMHGPWIVMLHGFADVVFDDQGGHRGDRKVFSDNMGMAMARRPLGAGTLGLRAMMSIEPATIGKEGYPLLLQTGETADGRTPLIDRQHPHDLFMELAGSYSISSGTRSVFVYGGLPGEPALGPPAFMHRFSGLDIPVAPITHHWLDSTHIAWGVLTAGAVADGLKLEASAFRGREPDQNRWDLEAPRLDSHSFRVSWNPLSSMSLQASYGRLHHPEQLEPTVDQDRATASAMFDGHWQSRGRWEAMLAWGEDRNRPGHTLDAATIEGALTTGPHVVFARLERVAKDELFIQPDPRAGRVFEVGEFTAGYRHDFAEWRHLRCGAGVAGIWPQLPDAIQSEYGRAGSALLFVHAALE